MRTLYQYALELFDPAGARLGLAWVMPDWEPARQWAAFQSLRRDPAGNCLPDTAGASADVLTSELAASGKAAASLVACAGDGRAVLLSLKKGADLSAHPVLSKFPEPLRRTDVALLHMGLLEPVLDGRVEIADGLEQAEGNEGGNGSRGGHGGRGN